MSAMAAALARYLEVRQHTLSTAGLVGAAQIRAEAEYVRGEAMELVGAVNAMCAAWEAAFTPPPDRAKPARYEHALTEVRHEIADVALANACLAGMLDVTVEDCIAEKTEADRGRG